MNYGKSLRRLMAVVAEMETSSGAKGFLSEEEEVRRKEVRVVGVAGKFLGGGQWKLWLFV